MLVNSCRSFGGIHLLHSLKSAVRCGFACLVLCFATTLAARADTFKQFVSLGTSSGGYQPSSCLLLASDGNFYGTTRYSTTPSAPGVLGGGTIYKITPAGVFTVLYRFGTAPNDGAQPEAGLMEGSDHNFYGTTSYSALTGVLPSGRGTVFKMTPEGVLTTLYTFGTSANDGAFPRSVLVQDGQGNLYGTTVYTTVTDGLNDGSGTVFKIGAGGVFSTLYTFGTTPNDGARPMAGLTFGLDGNLYGATFFTSYSILGGSGCGTVFQITTAATPVFKTFLSFDPDPTDYLSTKEGANPMGGLTLGPDGNFYGTTEFTSNINGTEFDGGTIFQVNTKGQLLTLYKFANPYPYPTLPDGANPQATLTLGSDGFFYGTTFHTTAFDRHRTAHGSIFKFALPYGPLTTLYFLGANVDDGTEPTAPVTEGADGNFYLPTSSGGLDGLGNVLELVNPIKVPVPNDPASAGGISQITLHARVNPGGKPTTVYFQYGPTTAYGKTTTPVAIGGGTAPVAVSAVVTDLTPNATYHYRVVAKNGTATEYSPDQSFGASNAGPDLVANDDTAVATGSGAIVIDVLANDTTFGGTPAVAFTETQPLHGHVTVGFDNRITYQPNVNFATFGGTDSFTYLLDGTKTATVTISNPFFTQAGSFTGELAAPGGGFLSLVVARTGTFTGRLRLGNTSHLLLGRFDADGHSQATIAGQVLSLQFPPPLPPATSLSQSTITGSYGSTALSIVHAAGYSPQAPAPEFGRYTMLLPAAGPAQSTVPGGTGYALVTVSPKGGVVILGRLADGAVFSQANYLTGGGMAGADKVSIYAKLAYKLPGLLSGDLTFETEAGVSDFDGVLTWAKPTQVHDTMYALGFTTGLPAIGARYQAPPRFGLALDPSVASLQAEVDLSGPTLTSAISKQVTISLGPTTASNRVTIFAFGDDRLTMAINATTGYFRGTFSPAHRAEANIQGVVFQGQRRGEGWFTYAGQSGAVIVTTAP